MQTIIGASPLDLNGLTRRSRFPALLARLRACSMSTKHSNRQFSPTRAGSEAPDYQKLRRERARTTDVDDDATAAALPDGDGPDDTPAKRRRPAGGHRR